MSYEFQVKTPKGNLFTVRGSTAEETKGNLDAAASSGLLGTIADIEASLAGVPSRADVSVVASVHPDGTVSTVDQRAAQPAQELPASFGVKCKTCGGDTKFAREGVSTQSGTPYRQYTCTTSQLHKPTYV